MPSLAPCVWLQLAFSCFHCTKSTPAQSIIGTGNRQPGYDFICKPHCYQVTHVSHAGAGAPSQASTSAGPSLQPAASETAPRRSPGAQHPRPQHTTACSHLLWIPARAPRNQPPSQLSRWIRKPFAFCVHFRAPFTPAPSSTGLFTWNKTGQHKEDRKREKKNAVKFLFYPLILVSTSSTELITAELSKKALPLQLALRHFCCFWMQKIFSVSHKKRCIFLH